MNIAQLTQFLNVFEGLQHRCSDQQVMSSRQIMEIPDQRHKDCLKRFNLDTGNLVELVHNLGERFDVVGKVFEHFASLQPVVGVVGELGTLHHQIEAFAEIFRITKALTGRCHCTKASNRDSDLVWLRLC